MQHVGVANSALLQHARHASCSRLLVDRMVPTVLCEIDHRSTAWKTCILHDVRTQSRHAIGSSESVYSDMVSVSVSKYHLKE